MGYLVVYHLRLKLLAYFSIAFNLGFRLYDKTAEEIIIILIIVTVEVTVV